MRHGAKRSGRQVHSQQKAERGRPLEPPVRLIMAAMALGMLVGAVAAPAGTVDTGLNAWLRDLVTAQAPVADEP